jgi:hypothetical protein
MRYQSTIILENISTESADSTFLFSEKYEGAGYRNLKDNTHTIQYILDNFIGTIKVQATLAIHPGADDWSDISLTEIGGDSSAISDSYAFSFSGNYVWIRAAYNLQNGTITQIRYNL